jgi:lysophospholipase L1-like esterase
MRHLLAPIALLSILQSGLPAIAADPQKPDRWESKIASFEARDREAPPPRDGIVFIGSSSIVGWKLNRFFPKLPVINRGFGGSEVADSVRYADRILLPYRPKVVVMYAGDNDIARGKSAEQVVADYRRFVKKIRTALPKTRIVYIAIKPSISRWALVDKMREANRQIMAIADSDPKLDFVDIDTPMIGEDGKPRKELFKPDGLHLNDEGYQVWSNLVRPHLKLD